MNIQRLLLSKDESKQRTLWANMLNSLFADKISVEELFSPNYQQYSDGKTLDFTHFINHLSHLRDQVNIIEFEVRDICISESRLAERHIATVTHHDGKVSKLEVYAFIRLHEHKIISLHEISRVISGTEQDKELASVTSL